MIVVVAAIVVVVASSLVLLAVIVVIVVELAMLAVIVLLEIVVVVVLAVVAAAQVSYLLCIHSFRIYHNKTNQKSEEIFAKLTERRINFEGRRELKTHTEFLSKS